MLCICKKCCCGVELANGVAIFAYFDIILHLIFLPVPGRLYEIYPLAKYAIAWIFIRCKFLPLKIPYVRMVLCWLNGNAPLRTNVLHLQ